jgi:ArsR family transcriptional regulator, arsenate/arsenite/antimonite-responsive transcriptional repressor / arsenate reductase (thioredoxin)
MGESEREVRVRRYAALADPVRLTIVDELVASDRSPIELRRLVGVESNLLAHHLDVLEQVGMINRSRSSGDGRRRYVHLEHSALDGLQPGMTRVAGRALFVCTRNSARSQLGAALWRSVTKSAAESAGTHPADRVHPGAVAAARRAKLPLEASVPRSIDEVRTLPSLVITVCDQAHEELDAPDSWLHWSIPDPIADGSAAAFDATVRELRRRIHGLVSQPVRREHA